MVVRESVFRDVLRLLVWYPLRWLVLLAPVGAGLRILGALGDVHCALSRGRRRLLLANLARIDGAYGAPGDRRARAAVRAYFRNHYVDRLLIFIFPKFGKRAVAAHVEFSGLEHLDRALAGGRGVVLVHGHFGPVHLPLVALARLGYPMKQIGLPSDEGLSWIGRNVAYRLRVRYERMMPAQIIHADGFMRPAFAWLKDNGVLMVTGDGSGTETRVGRHQTLRFFGQPVLFPLGPFLLARKTGAAVLPMFITPKGPTAYRVVIEEPLGQGAADDDAAAAAARFVRRLEARVAENPGYMHFLDRFSPGQLIVAEPAERRGGP